MNNYSWASEALTENYEHPTLACKGEPSGRLRCVLLLRMGKKYQVLVQLIAVMNQCKFKEGPGIALIDWEEYMDQVV
jgi:hypothetical protein